MTHRAIPAPPPEADTVHGPRLRGDLGASLPSQALARHLLSGEMGLRLYRGLADQFPAIRRTEVFLGIALAWTDLQAALVGVEAELAHLRRQLGTGVST